MTSLHHGRFREELSKLLQRLPSESDRYLAWSALMWLSIAQRPLRAHELWIALQVEESRDAEHIERLLTEPAYVDEPKAADALRDLLGGLVTVAPPPSSSSSSSSSSSGSAELYVALCDPELRTYLGYLSEVAAAAAAAAADDGQGSAASADPVSVMGFSTPQAHIVVAGVCMVVCSVTTLHLARAHDDARASSLVLYAWSHWASHLALSGYTLANPNAVRLADAMLFGVSTDLLVFLLALNDFATGPITFSSSSSSSSSSSAVEDRLARVAEVQRLQKALEGPLLLLSSLVRRNGYADTLQGARDIFEASKNARTGTSTSSTSSNSADASKALESPLAVDGALLSQLPRVGSQVETLQVDKFLPASLPRFGEPERQLVRGFAELARGLRLVAVTLGSSKALYDELLGLYEEAWSPLDVLVNAAVLMESVAGYPYWQEMSEGPSPNPLSVSDPSDAYFDATQVVLSRVRRVGTAKKPAPGRTQSGTAASSSSAPKLPLGISAPRWYAATAVEKLSGWVRRPPPSAAFTVNDVRLLSQRTTSFASLPPEVQGGDPLLRWAYERLPAPLRRFYRGALAVVLGPARRLGIVKSLDEFSAGAFTAGVTTNWPLLKAALLADGYRAAAAYFAVAILTNHLRRAWAPWLATYVFCHPMDDLRLVLQRPDLFLEKSLGVSWLWLGFSHAQKYASDLLGGLCMGLLLIGSNHATTAAGGQQQQQQVDPNVKVWLDRLGAVAKVGYLLWVLAMIDYIFARATTTISFVLAFGRLLAGGDAEHIALGSLIKTHWPKLLVLGPALYGYLRSGLWPMLYGSVLCAVVGQPGLLLALSSVVAAVFLSVRYRSRLYLALELSGLLLATTFAAVTAVLLLSAFVHDPLGLAASTSSARRRAARARAALPVGASARSMILRGKAALPVRRPGAGSAAATVETAPEVVDVAHDASAKKDL